MELTEGREENLSSTEVIPYGTIDVSERLQSMALRSGEGA
jgi:hypothetical protein